MKKDVVLLTGLLAILLAGCNPEDDMMNMPTPETLPDVAYDFIDANYANYTLGDVELEELCNGDEVFEVELEDGPGPDVDLYFDEDGNLLFSATELDSQELPTEVISGVETEFPGSMIDDDAYQLDYPDGVVEYLIDVELADETEIEAIFGADGVLICSLEDDDDDEEEEEEEEEEEVELPTDVDDFIASQYPDYEIDDVETDDLCDGTEVYEVSLENGNDEDLYLYFDQDWNLLFEGVEILAAELPAAVIAVLQADYAGYTLEDDEVDQYTYTDGSVSFELELESTTTDEEVELLINADGTIVCEEVDDEEDEDDPIGDDLPMDVQSFIEQNYPGYSFEEADEEDLCGDVEAYVIELEDGPGADLDLFFDVDWNFLFAAEEMLADDLPQAILDAIESAYPGAEIEEDAYQYTLADGSLQYEVSLETQEDGIEVVFAADGSVVCEEED